MDCCSLNSHASIATLLRAASKRVRRFWTKAFAPWSPPKHCLYLANKQETMESQYYPLHADHTLGQWYLPEFIQVFVESVCQTHV